MRGAAGGDSLITPHFPWRLKGIAAYGCLLAERSRFPPRPALDHSNLPYAKFPPTGSRAGRAQRHAPGQLPLSASWSAECWQGGFRVARLVALCARNLLRLAPVIK